MRRKQMKSLTEQIEHFLLYEDEPLPESLSEGSAANLQNLISRLEQQLLVERRAAHRQERQTVRFVENMAHQMKNAVEHTAPGSTVTASCFDEKRDIRIQIMDEGSGIPPEEQVTLFERFHRGGTSKAGYGIGLSMAKDIIAAHHGTVSARNREGRGALFEIVLPVLEGAKAYT